MASGSPSPDITMLLVLQMLTLAWVYPSPGGFSSSSLPILALSPCVLLHVLPTDQRFRRTTEGKDLCLPINEGHISFLVPAIKSTKTQMA